MRLVDDRERRARLAVRHGLHPEHRASGPVGAAEAVVCLHATEAATVHLAVGARTRGTTPADVETALYEDRSLVKQLAMRRTLFAFPRDLLPAALGVALSRIAPEQRRLIARDAARHGIAADGDAWLDAAGAAVVDRLTGSPALPARALREELPELSGAITVNADKRYGGTFNLAPRVLTWLGAEGRLTRGPNAGHWRLSKPAWTLLPDWLGESIAPLPLDDAYAQLVRRWLARFGPGTLEDVQWWLGATKGATRAALTAVGAVEVALERERTGWVLPDDLDPVADVSPWAALLPTLDPTTMGWRHREAYLDPAHRELLFDSNGNGGSTAWWDGRIVGAWVQDDDGVVSVVECPGTDLGGEGRSALALEAQRLTAWLDGVRITNVYSSRLMKGEALP
ncbi:winged helix DNA-binding domain-containing protein [Janibacter limosus]|uniref:Winged helix DNA-binding domain-containing protein n=1 Tax=Janibacter limosus TaxID=53458 RepID=A0A4P6MX82_9MICO|nr:winged helix DNA-binding domain-containing protein [Janibacter limosus]QBF47692.1 winged helix DNA-binding domain-containing protein [Janibacter limosus]